MYGNVKSHNFLILYKCVCVVHKLMLYKYMTYIIMYVCAWCVCTYIHTYICVNLKMWIYGFWFWFFFSNNILFILDLFSSNVTARGAVVAVESFDKSKVCSAVLCVFFMKGCENGSKFLPSLLNFPLTPHFLTFDAKISLFFKYELQVV